MTGVLLGNRAKTPVAGGIITDGLVVHLDAADYSGSGNWLDNTANNNDFVFRGTSIDHTSGASGYVTFDGVDDYWDCAPTGVPTSTSDRSFELWMTKQDLTDFLTFFSQVGAGYATGDGIFGGADAADLLYVSTASGDDYNSGFTFTATAWVQVVFVLRGGDVEVYIDGSLDTDVTTITYNTSATPTLYLGCGWNAEFSFAGGPWIGDIAAFMVYDKALSTAEISTNYTEFGTRY